MHYWVFLRHFDKGHEKPLCHLKLPLSLLSRSPGLLELQLLLNRQADRRLSLSNEGKMRAEEFRKAFSRFLQERGMDPKMIIVSPFRRTMQTARIISSAVPAAQIGIDNRIRELDQGVRFARAFEEVCRAFPAYVEMIGKQGFLSSAPPGADTHAGRRDCDVASFLEDLKRIRRDAVIVTHAGIIECTHNLICRTSDDEVVKKFSEGRSARPGSIFLCSYDPGRDEIEPLLSDYLLV